jgi:hypothetical protein
LFPISHIHIRLDDLIIEDVVVGEIGVAFSVQRGFTREL